jgi:hypothetical protein
MRRAIGPILGLFLLVEIGVAVAIVLAYPGGFGALADFNVGPERRQEQPVQTFDLGGQTGNLVINNGAGRVTVEADPAANVVTVNATKVINGGNDEAFSRLNYSVTREGNTINIKAERGPTVGINFGARVDIQITTPRNLVANIETGSGNIRVIGLEVADQNFSLNTGSGSITATDLKAANVRLHTGSGGIFISNLSGLVDAEASSGSITLNNFSSATKTHLKTGSGSIKLDGITGDLDAETSSGTINVQKANVSDLRLNTGSGGISFNGQATFKDGSQIRTGSGSIDLNFTGLTDKPRFDVSTGSGSINFNVTGLNYNKPDKQHLITNNSGPLVKISTGSGSVKITG